MYKPILVNIFMACSSTLAENIGSPVGYECQVSGLVSRVSGLRSQLGEKSVYLLSLPLFFCVIKTGLPVIGKMLL